MDGMTGQNLLIKSLGKNKKKQPKTLLIIVIFVIILAIAVFALMYLGLI